MSSSAMDRSGEMAARKGPFHTETRSVANPPGIGDHSKLSRGMITMANAGTL
jgi:hypothetical protein